MKRYPNYKDSNIDWIGEIPDTWQIKKIKHGSYVKGRIGWKGLKSDEFLTEGYAFLITGTDFIDGRLDWDSCYHIDQERYEEDHFIQLKENDLLITKDGTIGKVALVKDLIGFACLNSGIFLVRPINGIYETDFLYWILNSNVFNTFINYRKTGSTISHLYQNVFVEFDFPVPTFEERKTITTFLDHKTQLIDDLIEKKERLIELLKEERIAVINQAVTKGLDPNVPMKDSGIEWLGEIPEHWEIRRVATLGVFSKGRGISRDEVLPDGIPCIRYGEIYTDYDRIVYNPTSFISKESSEKSEPIKKGNILFTASGETMEEIGKSIVYYGDADIYAGGDIIILKLLSHISPLFISFLMESHFVVQQKSRYGKGGIIVHIYAKQLREIFVTSPPRNEQDSIAEFLKNRTEKIDTQTQLIKDEIVLLEEYKKSLINEAVTGKIDVRDYKISI